VARWQQQKKVTIVDINSGRFGFPELNLPAAIGFFAVGTPFTLTLSSKMDFEETLLQLVEKLQEAPFSQRVYYNYLAYYINHHYTFNPSGGQIAFNFLGRISPGIRADLQSNLNMGLPEKTANALEVFAGVDEGQLKCAVEGSSVLISRAKLADFARCLQEEIGLASDTSRGVTTAFNR
jgi:hypothetical protein